MSGDLRQYDPQQVVGSFTWSGGSVDFLDGAVQPGAFVTRTLDNQRFTRETDRNGNATRVKNNNRGGTFSITLSASSPTNRQLSNLVNLDDTTENVVGTVVLKDLNGDTIMTATSAFIDGHPTTIEFGSERGSKVWTFQAQSIVEVIGGHDLA